MKSNAFTSAALRLCAMLFFVACPALIAAEKPNVILIITDDQGYGDLSSHGNPILKTPNMDRLRQESVRFTDFHVAPMCSPTRGQLMTGIDAMKNGCTAVCQGRSMMRSELPTMADFFADSGYATGHFGKWHLGDSYPHRPQDRGFQETIHHRAWGITSLADYWENNYFDPVLEHNGVDRKFEGYCTDIFFNESMSWIEKIQTKQNKPFFLYLPTNTPHVPNVCPESYSRPYQGQHEGKPIPDTFYGMIANLDENLGKLEAFLAEKGLRDNTLLIFTSDNGTQSKQAQMIFNAGMRDKKTSVYEGGHRVPCFVRWPDGKLKTGRDVDELTQVQDLLPTLIELCQLETEEKATKFDGTSLAGLLKGTEPELPDRKLVVQYRVSGEPWDPAVVLWDKWRLIGGTDLYHVGRDPGQLTNVADQEPDVVDAMTAHYEAWHQQAKPLFDQPRWISIGTEPANPMVLYAQDWTGGYCDNRGGLTQATAQGYWNVIVDREGIYEIELRRWPKESGKTLTEGIKGPQDTGISARPITAANVQVAGANYTLDTQPTGTHATFRIELPKGRTQLATTLMDADDAALCSAIYVYLKRLPKGEEAGKNLTPPSARRPEGTAKPAPRLQKKAKALKPAATVTLATDDILLADFEGGDYGDWKSTGTAFGTQPTVTKGRVNGHQGAKLADTFLINGGDKHTGSLTSPTFEIECKYLNFLIGGGKHPGATGISLLVDGKPTHSATGNSTKDSHNKKVMQWVSWDVSSLRGKQAQIEIFDKETGGWGHIAIDHIFQSNSKLK